MSLFDWIAATAVGLLLLTGAIAFPPAHAEERRPQPAAQTTAPGPANRKADVAQKPAAPPGMPLRAGSFPRSFLIPGTDTSISIGGR
jgi:hypothetical protein